MTHTINPIENIDDITAPDNFTLTINEFPEYHNPLYKNSVNIYIPSGSKGKYIEIDVNFSSEEYSDIALNGCSFRLPKSHLRHAGESYYALEFGDGEMIEIPLGENFDTITVPFRNISRFRLYVLTDQPDVICISDLRAVCELMPQDILEAFKVIELPSIEIGQVDVKQGDSQIRLSDVTNIVEDAVISFNNESHQVERIVGNLVTLATTFDGELVKSDYIGSFSLQCPVSIGYYDQDAKLPSVVLWFSSPTPVLRSVKKERYQVFGIDAYYKEPLQLMSWVVKIDVVGGTPEITQMMSTHVRKFLEKNQIWINGKRFTFEWIDGAVDTEPSSYLDILSSVVYNINIGVKEEFLWQTEKMGRSKIRNVSPMLKI